VDNLCHTLTGAVLAETGLKVRTRFGAGALMLAANLPDVDVLAFLSETPAVAIRRGWTHGILAQALLPVVLTAAFVLYDRWRPPRGPTVRRLNVLPLLALCYAGVLSHVGMDWLNNYGVRLLMPLSNRWFYGDSVFIVDPWLWMVLGAGVAMSRRRRAGLPALLSLAVAVVYIMAMTASAGAARHKVLTAWTEAKGIPPAALMVGPVPLNPVRKVVIIDAGESYERGTFTWLPTRVRFDPEHVLKNDRHPAVIQAVTTSAEIRALLVWARFPYFDITPVPGGTRVTLADMRFGAGLFQATTIVATPNSELRTPN
jgi:inner membrane protein